MKKIASLFLALIMVFSICAFNASASITNANDVGAVGDEISLAPGFTESQLKRVRQLIKEEYNRGIVTRSVKHKGKAWFDYGNSTGEYVHAWVGSDRTTGEGVTLAAAACMNQDFTGGYSDSLEVLGQGANWCCILVTPESLAKGEAYTVRDGIANKWGSEGGTNSFWGLPTSNQYWVGSTCYQQFERGYAVSEKAQLIFTEFYAADEEGYVPPPALPGPGSNSSYDYDWGEPDPPKDGIQTTDPTVPDLPGGVTITVKKPEAPTQPGDAQTGEPQDGQPQDGEHQDGQPQDGENQTGEDQTGEGATGEVVSKAGNASSKKSGAVTTTTTYFLGMELTPELQRNLIIGGIALAVLIIAIVVVIIVLVKKKKAKAAAAETPAENAPADEAAAEEAPKDEAAAEEAPKDEENK